MRRCVLALLALGFACASAGPAAAPATAAADPAAGRSTGGPGAAPRDAPEVEPEPGEDLVEAALLASGYEPGVGLRRARADLERHLGSAVGQASGHPEERARGRALLDALHAKGGLLGQYDARATTLKDVLDRRRYNCVSASVLYNLAAARLKLAVGAQLLPTHARSLLSVQEPTRLVRVAVETTSALGFDPDPATEARILAHVSGPSVAGARALVSEQGEVVSTRVLIGTIYVNRASITQESGDLQGAQRLFAQGEAFATSDGMRRVLRDQRAALLAQLAADDVLSEDPKRYLRAYQTLKAAAKLGPEDDKVRMAVFHNLRAAAERVINVQAEKGDEEGLVRLAGEASATGLTAGDRSGLRAFALSEVARLRIDKGAYDAAVEAIDLALREQLGPRDVELANILELNRVAALRLAAMTHAKAGRYPEADAYLERIARLPKLSVEQREQLSADRLRIIHLVGNQRIDAMDYGGAAAIYREGTRRFAHDETSRHNLLAVLERLATPLVKAGRCEEARPHLEEIAMLSPGADFVKQASLRCLIDRARQSLEADDPKEAVALLAQALSDGHEDPAIHDALAVAYARWIQDAARARRCDEARQQARRLHALKDRRWPRAKVQALLGSCKS